MEWLPLGRVFAVDGVQSRFEGGALMTSHLHQVLLRNAVRFAWAWVDHVSDCATVPAAIGLSDFPAPPQGLPEPRNCDLDFEIMGVAFRKFPRRPTPSGAVTDGPVLVPAGGVSYAQATLTRMSGVRNRQRGSSGEVCSDVTWSR